MSVLSSVSCRLAPTYLSPSSANALLFTFLTDMLTKLCVANYVLDSPVVERK